MNPITAFFVQNIIAVYFFYGLAFFAMGLALALATRRTSELGFARAIRPLAAFGVVHGIHEWFEMFQKIAAGAAGHSPTLLEEGIRLAILVSSFAVLAYAGLQLLRSDKGRRPAPLIHASALTLLWALSVLGVVLSLAPSGFEVIGMADVLSRYLLAVPGALLAAWGLMKQQRAFREHGMPQFGRDLVWSATALFLYGVLGQLFVRETVLPPSTVVNASLFLQWFGIPVQLFRGVMASMVAVYMVRALNAFELEDELRTARLNEELRLTARELSWLLNLSNLLEAPMSLQERLDTVLGQIVDSLSFPDSGIVLLARRATGTLRIWASVGYDGHPEAGEQRAQCAAAVELAGQCVEQGLTVCLHSDGKVFEFAPHDALERQKCRQHPSPTVSIALPLSLPQQVIGAIVLSQLTLTDVQPIPIDEFRLMVGTVQQLGLSIENARLYQEAQEREKRLADLLRQSVGAQEAERQRIARELHDVTGQSLTAIALGLRGVETVLMDRPTLAVEQVRELRSFGTSALSELRHIIADLRPPQLDDLGLVAALEWYAQEFEKRYAIRTEFVLQGDRFRLTPEYETVLFRIAQEALTNVARHAAATEARVRLEVVPGEVCIAVEDDGRGFDPQETLRDEEPEGWGLRGIQERASLLGGQCVIDSVPGRGTRVQVTVPVHAEEDGVQDTVAAG